MARAPKGPLKTPPANDGTAASLRIDLFLWQARLARSRPAAQELANQGHVRLNGRRVERAHVPVRAGDVLTLPAHGPAKVIRVLALPARRGPPAEALALYTVLENGATPPMHIDAEPTCE